MEEKYTMSLELKEFLKDNQELINMAQWQELLYKASKTKNLLIGELIYVLVAADLPNKADKTGNPIITSLSLALDKMIKNHKILEESLKNIKL